MKPPPYDFWFWQNCPGRRKNKKFKTGHFKGETTIAQTRNKSLAGPKNHSHLKWFVSTKKKKKKWKEKSNYNSKKKKIKPQNHKHHSTRTKPPLLQVVLICHDIRNPSQYTHQKGNFGNQSNNCLVSVIFYSYFFFRKSSDRKIKTSPSFQGKPNTQRGRRKKKRFEEKRRLFKIELLATRLHSIQRQEAICQEIKTTHTHKTTNNKNK